MSPGNDSARPALLISTVATPADPPARSPYKQENCRLDFGRFTRGEKRRQTLTPAFPGARPRRCPLSRPKPAARPSPPPSPGPGPHAVRCRGQTAPPPPLSTPKTRREGPVAIAQVSVSSQAPLHLLLMERGGRRLG